MSPIRRLLTSLFLITAAWPALAAPQDTGIVLMHGKWDRPPTHVAGLAQQLAAEGFVVVQPLMPWSSLRDYDVTYPQALAEIDAAIQGLRSKGATRIVVAGLSFGGNAALAYAGSGHPVDAIVVLSPGHTPDRGQMRKAVEGSVAKAKAMVEAGNGQERAAFDDTNQGRSKQVRVTADAYLSYFDPEGLGAMGKQAAAIAKPLPIFMAVGSSDRIADYAEEGIFRKAPAHPQSSYLSLPADHTGLAAAVGTALSAWLKALKP